LDWFSINPHNLGDLPAVINRIKSDQHNSVCWLLQAINKITVILTLSEKNPFFIIGPS